MRAIAGRALIFLLAVAGCNTAPEPTAAVRGKVKFEKYCAQCHLESGYGNPDIAAPAIAGLPEWYITRQLDKYRAGIRGAHFDDIEGFRMRPMSLTLRSGDDVAEVASYVSSLPPTMPAASVSGDPEKGKSLYATCTACHGAEGKGNEQLGSPPLTQTHDWYLVTQLKKFKGGVRAYDDRDTWGATMAPMAAGLTDEQAMNDVVAYIHTLRK